MWVGKPTNGHVIGEAVLFELIAVEAGSRKRVTNYYYCYRGTPLELELSRAITEKLYVNVEDFRGNSVEVDGHEYFPANNIEIVPVERVDKDFLLDTYSVRKIKDKVFRVTA